MKKENSHNSKKWWIWSRDKYWNIWKCHQTFYKNIHSATVAATNVSHEMNFVKHEKCISENEWQRRQEKSVAFEMMTDLAQKINIFFTLKLKFKWHVNSGSEALRMQNDLKLPAKEFGAISVRCSKKRCIFKYYFVGWLNTQNEEIWIQIAECENHCFSAIKSFDTTTVGLIDH